MMCISQKSFSYYRLIDQGCKETYNYLKNEGIINQDNTVDDLKMLSERQTKILKDESKSGKIEVDNQELRVTILNCESINSKYWQDLQEDCIQADINSREVSTNSDNSMRLSNSLGSQQFSFKRQKFDSERIVKENEKIKTVIRIAEQKPVIGGPGPRPPILNPKINKLKSFNNCK